MREATPRLLALAGCVLLLASSPAVGDAERRAASDFHQRARVEGQLVPGEPYAIPLSDEAVAALHETGELRLFDADGRELPSVLETARRRRKVVERPARLFNQAWTADGVQTFSVELTERTADPVNEFVVTIDSENFHQVVRVEGTNRREDEGGRWKLLVDGLHLIRHRMESEKIDYVHDVLRIPPARFRYYRFTLTPRTPLEQEDGRPFEVSRVEVREVVRTGSSAEVSVALSSMDDPQDDDPRHHYFLLELPEPGLAVDRVELTIPDDDFARSASLWEWSEERGRRTRLLARTVLFRYGMDERSAIRGFQTDAARLALMLDQGDDEPVSVAAATAHRPSRQLRFLAPDPLRAPLFLHFDPDQARTPRYDLARRIAEREISSFGTRAHAALEENPSYERPLEPRSERAPYLLYLLVVPLIAVLVAYVARSIRRGLPEEAPPDDA